MSRAVGCCGHGSLREARCRGSRRSSAIEPSCRRTARHAGPGLLALRRCSRPAPTGFAGSRTSSSPHRCPPEGRRERSIGASMPLAPSRRGGTAGARPALASALPRPPRRACLGAPARPRLTPVGRRQSRRSGRPAAGFRAGRHGRMSPVREARICYARSGRWGSLCVSRDASRGAPRSRGSSTTNRAPPPTASPTVMRPP